MAGVKKLLELKCHRDGSVDDTFEMLDSVWKARATAVRTWMESNEDFVPKDGARSTIFAQLKRGDENIGARNKCWNHLEVELEAIPQWELKPVETKSTALMDLPLSPHTNSKEGPPLSPPFVPMLKISKSDSIMSAPRSQSARSCSGDIGLMSMNLTSARTVDEEEKAIKGIDRQMSENIEPEPMIQKPISKMTMMERQAYWLAKKKETLEAQRAEKEKENDNYTFKPNTMSSKRSFQPTPKPIIPITQTISSSNNEKKENKTNNKNSNPTGNSDSKWKVVKNKVKIIAQSNNSNSSIISSTSTNTNVEKKKLVNKTRMAKKLERGNSTDSLGTMSGIKTEQQKLLSSASCSNLKGVEESIESKKELVEEAVQGAIEDQVEDNVNEEEETKEEEEVEAEPAPYVPGEFWWRIDGGRGQHRVNDGSEFQMWSIYRRRDKSRDIKGVSMLVGRMEAPPYDEKVIQIMFDTEEWTEEAAFRWWQINNFRYTGTADKETGKLKLEVVKKQQFTAPPPTTTNNLNHSPIRSRSQITTSPIENSTTAATEV